MLRHSFLTMLKDDFGVRMVGDPQSYFDMPLTNQIDLGQGNTVMPYVVNKMANLRVMTKFNYNSHNDCLQSHGNDTVKKSHGNII